MTNLTLPRQGGHTLAYRRHEGAGPAVVWLGGFKSDLTGTKAAHLHGWAERTGRGYVRFDYFGHGASSGDFRKGTISRWLSDSLAVLDGLTAGPLVLVGSSMGGWLATLAALQRPERVKGIVYIAPALDMTELFWSRMDEAVKAEILEKGEWARPSAYGPEPYPMTRGLIEDGRQHLLLDGPIALEMPVRILHGQDDPDVPWQHSLKLIAALASRDVVLTLVKGGDHRLSKPADLARLTDAVEELSG
ncbi:MAG: alpha/beta hydrolase [Alphaproteobacteria bacterium]|nr:alpha/beta hydrolase [Alphaproteobacteria bacterium]